jgi:hypothetical protein
MWLQTLLKELDIPSPRSVELWCDNMRATYLTYNHVFLARMKHIEVNYHFVHERVAHELLELRPIRTKDEVRPISTKDRVADGFTMPLTSRLLERFKGHLNVSDCCD